MNPVQRALLERRSIRSFLPTPVTDEELSSLAEAVLAAPSGMDRQPWKFFFVTAPAVLAAVSTAALDEFRRRGDHAVLDRLASRQAVNLFYGAPLVAFVSIPRGSSPLDAGIAAQNLVLAAQGLGLGSCYIGLAAAAFVPPEAASRTLVGFDAGDEFAIAIALGHPAHTKDAHPRKPDRVVWVRSSE